MTTVLPYRNLSVVVPVYNEDNQLEERVSHFAATLDAVVEPGQWEIQLINNGSRDTTSEVIDRLGEKFPSVIGHSLPNPNYGLAIRYGITMAAHSFVYIVDLDQWDDAFIHWSWSYRHNYDLIISSKRADPSINHQTNVRYLLSWGLNAALQLLFAFPGSDTHGQKLLNCESLSKVLETTKSERGQYDVELVVRALRSGKKLIELPVPYREVRPARNALIKKILWNCWALSKLAWRLRSVRQGPVYLRRISRLDVTERRGFSDDTETFSSNTQSDASTGMI